MGMTRAYTCDQLAQRLTHSHQIIALGLSIDIWVFASITGIREYKIDFMNGGVQRSTQGILTFSLILQFSLMAVKISILFFYKRIFHTRPFSIAAWMGIVLVGLWGLVFFFVWIHPLQRTAIAD